MLTTSRTALLNRICEIKLMMLIFLLDSVAVNVSPTLTLIALSARDRFGCGRSFSGFTVTVAPATVQVNLSAILFGASPLPATTPDMDSVYGPSPLTLPMMVMTSVLVVMPLPSSVPAAPK